MATPDDKDSSAPDESQITLWSRLWSCTRGDALSRIMTTRQIMAFRSTEKSAAKDRKWVQVASMWEPQGIGRLEWEHWVQTGSFGADVEVFGVRGLSRSGRGSESSYEEASEDDERDGEKDAVTGDISPTSTNDSHGNAAPPPSPASPPYPHSIHSSDDSIADDVFHAALALVDEHGVDRGQVVAKAVWTALRDHLECVRHGGDCTASCLVCKLIRAKFDQIRDEHGSCKKRRDSPDWSTTVNASESPRSNDISFAAPAEAEVDVGPHELDASQTSKRSIDEALPPDERVGMATASPVVFVPPPRHVTYRSYQAIPASRAIVFDSSASSSLHPHRARLVPVSGRSRSAPCLSQHPIHNPISPLLSPIARTLDTPLVSPRTGIDTSNGNTNANAKPSPLRALARFVNNKSKQFFDLPLSLSTPRQPRSAPPSFIGSPVPPGAAAQMGGCARRRSSFAFPFSPRPDGVFGRGRFASFSPLCSPRTVDACAAADADADGDRVQRDETAAKAPISPPPEREWEREGKSTIGAVVWSDTATPSMTTNDGRRRGSGKGRRASASARAWSSVVVGPTATARKWARRNAARVLPGGGGQTHTQSQDAGLRGGGRGRGRGRDGAGGQEKTKTYAAVAAAAHEREREREREKERARLGRQQKTSAQSQQLEAKDAARPPNAPQPSKPLPLPLPLAQLNHHRHSNNPHAPRTPRLTPSHPSPSASSPPRISLCLPGTHMEMGLDLDAGMQMEMGRVVSPVAGMRTRMPSRGRAEMGREWESGGRGGSRGRGN